MVAISRAWYNKNLLWIYIYRGRYANQIPGIAFYNDPVFDKLNISFK